MFNYVANKENYISFMDDNYLDSYGNPSNSYTPEEIATIISAIPDEHWFTFDKVKVYVNGSVEIVGAWFYNPKRKNDAKYIGEFTDGSATIEFREKKGDPILQWEGVLSNGKIINYESSKTLREGYGRLSTGNDFDSYDKCPDINKWLARSWIDEEEELFFLVENKQMLIDAANYYKLPVPYDTELETQIDNDLNSIRLKSVDMNHEGEGKFVAMVIAAVVFEDKVPTKLRLYKTSRWGG